MNVSFLILVYRGIEGYYVVLISLCKVIHSNYIFYHVLYFKKNHIHSDVNLSFYNCKPKTTEVAWIDRRNNKVKLCQNNFSPTFRPLTTYIIFPPLTS